MKKLSLNKYLANVTIALKLFFMKTDFQLEFKDNCEQPIITNFDEDMLSLAIFQIIANSCNFSPRGSTIRLVLSQHNDSAVITISDEGSGIDSKLIHRVFEPFFSIHASPVPEEDMGMGLGLPIAKKIIESHNGKIILNSELHKGTTIMLTLPIIDDNDSQVVLSSDTTKYMTDKFSNIYLIFANICKINLY